VADIVAARQALYARLLDGTGHSDPAQRRAAFDGASQSQPAHELLEKIRLHAHRVTDADVQQARAAGLTEDQLFELAVCAAVGQAGRQLDAALAALAAASGKE
jgi:alkylhydroperoxidase family enzyme